MHKIVISLAGFLGLTAVAMGAFAAHGLVNIIEPQNYAAVKISVDSAVNMQLAHAIVLLVLGLWLKSGRQNRQQNPVLGFAVVALVVGVVLFAGMIYLGKILAYNQVGFLVPLGGVILLLSWLLIMLAAWTAR